MTFANIENGKRKAAVLVAGSWGTALAMVLSENGFEVTLWTRTEAQAAEVNGKHRNDKYLPDCPLPESMTATTSMEQALAGAEVVLFTAPSSAMRDVARQAAPFLSPNALVIHATKGFEAETLKRMITVLSEELGRPEDSLCVLSGPSHAEEVAKQQPTTVVVASADQNRAEQAQDSFINSYFRVYTNPDVVGVEVGGAIKNIIAIGAGMTDGLGFGDNAKAALLTRGLAEISRLGTAMGANPLTFAGLAGVGDLVVTCNSKHSRNWRAGHKLAQGIPLAEVLEQMGMVVEGVKTTKAARYLSQKYDVEMPIADQLYSVLFEGVEPTTAVNRLMGRGRTHESEQVARDWGLHQS
ncbi:glycerol-3-phosphate dehydrogenase (NAD(P)+) [Paenibacillus cellulosilyticus]|uniref:Glycerol-3-phosphate dehydrogenase [NAD(P)+] n=1 Tax=Paenibacillus cellulosilyticus TaxID=375489 RepID=A0A2V2YWV5_9BACL|nr:NAD(P)H-dependent glycerol-3-phosphate dehydrogenase [Paenibacillus cellulosilyticus]PWW05565.1 glycerol-3-phosphate dehydrogenase (NAD(P)+) [Paenibacillus cellulosilyticus]QKS45399.1 NAD(P)H-dependent glycerol-3-phosphate dehydrogenase [Paenibacillus cellulosilyticus]